MLAKVPHDQLTQYQIKALRYLEELDVDMSPDERYEVRQAFYQKLPEILPLTADCANHVIDHMPRAAECIIYFGRPDILCRDEISFTKLTFTLTMYPEPYQSIGYRRMIDQAITASKNGLKDRLDFYSRYVDWAQVLRLLENVPMDPNSSVFARMAEQSNKRSMAGRLMGYSMIEDIPHETKVHPKNIEARNKLIQLIMAEIHKYRDY